jgi:hypothetical protein
MKATIFSLIALALGIATGVAWTRQEFAHEAVPVDLTPITINKDGTPSRPTIGPKVTIVNGERHDFGAMERNAHGKHAYIVRNDGDAPLTLECGQPSCGVCIKVFAVAKPVLGPGERTEVHIEWDVKNGDNKFEQSGPLKTNDPLKPSVHLSVTGQIIENVRLDHPDVHFHDLSPSESASATVNIYTYRDDELTIGDSGFSNPRYAKFLEHSFAPLSESEIAREPRAKGGFQLTISIKPGLPQGDFEETLTIPTNQSSEPLTVKVIGNIASDILLMGPNVYREKSLVDLKAISQATGKKHTIYLIVKGPHREETNVTIDSIEPKKDFSATLGEPIHDTAKTKRYPITIEIPPGAAPGTYGDGSYGHIRLKTTHPEIKDIDIRVRYVVRE